MIEIIVAIILQVTTILGGVDSDKGKAQPQEKAKTENPAKNPIQTTAEGGAGNWEG